MAGGPNGQWPCTQSHPMFALSPDPWGLGVEATAAARDQPWRFARGRLGYEKYRREFSKLIWQLASPKWNFDDATFDRTAAAFDNPDHVAIVIHNYRWRLGLAEGEPRFDSLERRWLQAR
jgi:hypothetical protein